MRIAAGAVSNTAGQASSGNADLNTFGLAGDVNRDKAVNFDDLLILTQNFNQTGKVFTQGNFNYSADGKVDFDDLLLLAQRYGTSLMSQRVRTTVDSRSRRKSDVDVLLA